MNANDLRACLFKRCRPFVTQRGSWYSVHGIDADYLQVYIPFFLEQAKTDGKKFRDEKDAFKALKRELGVAREPKRTLSLNAPLKSNDAVEYGDLVPERTDDDEKNTLLQYELASLRLDNWPSVKPIFKERVRKALFRRKKWQACSLYNRFASDKKHPCLRWEFDEVIDEIIAEGLATTEKRGKVLYYLPVYSSID